MDSLEEVFSLLVTGHYRTRPSDLKLLLDDPDLRIFRLLLDTGDNTVTVGVVLASLERRPDQELSEQILLGQRRPPGHVLAELLAGSAGIKNTIYLDMLRIRRIVVHPARQHRGLGSRMLRELGEHFSGRVSLIGTQFALSPDLVRFWRSADFEPIHLGTRPSRFAGEISGLFLQALDSSGQSVQQDAVTRFTRQFPQALPRYFKSLQPDLVHELIHGLPEFKTLPKPEELEEVADYSFGRVTESSVVASLMRCSLWALGTNDPRKDDLESSHLIVERVLQGRAWRNCTALSGEQGHRAGDSRLRRIFGSLLKSADPTLAQSHHRHVNHFPLQEKT